MVLGACRVAQEREPVSDTKDIEAMLDRFYAASAYHHLSDGVLACRSTILAAFADLERSRDQYRNDALGLTSALAERDAKIAKLEKWAQDMVELQASGGRLDGYRALGAKVAEREEQIDALRAELTKRDARIAELEAQNATLRIAFTDSEQNERDSEETIEELEKLLISVVRALDTPVPTPHQWSALRAKARYVIATLGAARNGEQS